MPSCSDNMDHFDEYSGLSPVSSSSSNSEGSYPELTPPPDDEELTPPPDDEELQPPPGPTTQTILNDLLVAGNVEAGCLVVRGALLEANHRNELAMHLLKRMAFCQEEISDAVCNSIHVSDAIRAVVIVACTAVAASTLVTNASANLRMLGQPEYSHIDIDDDVPEIALALALHLLRQALEPQEEPIASPEELHEMHGVLVTASQVLVHVRRTRAYCRQQLAGTADLIAESCAMSYAISAVNTSAVTLAFTLGALEAFAEQDTLVNETLPCPEFAYARNRAQTLVQGCLYFAGDISVMFFTLWEATETLAAGM